MKNETLRTFKIQTHKESNFFAQVKKIIGLLSLVMMIFSGLTQKTFACGEVGFGYSAAPVAKSKKDREIERLKRELAEKNKTIKYLKQDMAMYEFKMDFAEERVSSCEEKLGRLSPIVNQSPNSQIKVIVNNNFEIIESSVSK